MNEDKRTEKRKVGDIGEGLAVKYLESHGYRIVDRNFSCKTGELDIIVLKPKEHLLSFVEVKSRNTLSYGLPCQAVTLHKQRCIKLTAKYYLLIHPCYQKYLISFDIVEILRLSKGTYLRHLKNAFM